MSAHEPLLKCRKFSIERWTEKLPSGEAATREVVVHPGAVAILPILDDGRIVLIRNFRVTTGGYLLELPAGTLEADEKPEACAARELTEETGYRARQFEPMGFFYSSPGILTERMYGFVATGLTHVGQSLDEGENIELDPHTERDVRRMLSKGEFHDGKTIAILGQYFLSRA
jgi:ADP-ribose pyrophosphatase